MTGVYLLILNSKVVYIGATTNWPMRITQHKEINFDEARIIVCDYSVLFANERRLIRIFKPRHNKQHALKTTRKPVGDWVRDNLIDVRSYYENGQPVNLLDRVKSELGYSQKTQLSDISFVVLKRFCQMNGLLYDEKRMKFKSIK